jgi:hypothetical protein
MSGRGLDGRLLRIAVVVAILGVGVPISLSQLGSVSDARFGASEQLGPSQLAAATISVAPGRRSVDLSVVGMTPGDRARGRLDIVNDGTLPIRYSLAVSFNGSSPAALVLAEELEIQIWTATTCGIRPPSAASVLTPRRPLAPAGVVFGNPDIGPDRGDRELTVGGTDTICYSIELDIDASNAVATKTLRQQFVVQAEHLITPETES